MAVKSFIVQVQLDISRNFYARHEKFVWNKHSSLFSASINDGEDKLNMTATPGVNVIKLFSFVTDDEA